jgi:hypothetical protein
VTSSFLVKRKVNVITGNSFSRKSDTCREEPTLSHSAARNSALARERQAFATSFQAERARRGRGKLLPARAIAGVKTGNETAQRASSAS